MISHSAQSNNSPTCALSEFITRTRYDALSEEVCVRAKLLILDALGCMIGGARIEPGQAILKLVANGGGKGPATLWATGERMPTTQAAYANGYLTNVLDFDDTDLGHPGTTILPAALAVAEQVGASGPALIKAVVMGYEVYVRLTTALRASTTRNQEFGGFSSTQLLGVFAATTAAGILLDLDAASLARAYGIAAEHAPIPASLNGFVNQRPLSWMKNNSGWVCLGGVLSAELTRAGFSASPAIFDSRSRLWMRVGSDQYAPEALVSGLGEHYHIMDISIKPYPCCRYLHTTLDALNQILHEHRVDAQEVANVQVHAFTRLGGFLDFQPQTIIDAQYSLPFAVAMTLLGRQPGHDWLDSAPLNDPDVSRIARRVTFVPNQEADRIYFDFDKRRYPTTVTLNLNEGTRYESSAEIPLGDPRNFITPAVAVEKFMRLSEPVLGASAARKLAERIENIETNGKIDALRAGIYCREE
ncbi:2-methylcitrate dehydratase [Anaerolineae bacterium]|nr:2-methylcitrate dehydratase [Anaerolineae bacterium]